MRFYWLTLGVLATWRVTHLLTVEDGPANLLARLRRWMHVGFTGTLFTCFYCMSLWVSAPIAMWLGERWAERLLLWPALSAGAILLERVTGVEAAPYREDPDDPVA
jgi:hypothetical protein